MAMTHVSPEQAMQSRYYGFGGWLLVIYVLSVLGALSTLYEIFDALNMIGANKADLAGIDPVLGAFMAAIQLALALPFLVLAPMKHPMMPLVSIACLWFSVAFMIVHLAIQGPLLAAALEQLAKEMPNQSGAAIPDGIAGLVVGSTLLVALGFSVLFSALVTWYLLASKRVNATYRHRIPGGLALAAHLQMQPTQGMPQTGAPPTAGPAL